MAGAAPPKGLGGWLILVIIGLIVSPVLNGYLLATGLWPILHDGTWSSLTIEGSDAYHPLWAPLLIFEGIGSVVAIALPIVTLVFLFRKSRHTPRLAISWLACMAGFAVADYFAASLIPAIAAQPDPA